jgi:hypothetical protein
VTRRAGCGLWLVWMVVALFGAEWLLLAVVTQWVPKDYLPLAVLTIAILTIIGACLAIYLRMQRRPR